MSADCDQRQAGRSGWFPDPAGRHEFRFHNGAAWTADVADGGIRFVDSAGPVPDVGPPGAIAGPTTVTAAPERNRIAVAGLVCGILGIGLGLIPFVFVLGLVAAVLAIVFGSIGLRRSGDRRTRRSAAIAALVTGVFGLLAGIGGALLTGALIRAIDRFEEPGEFELGPVSCEADDPAWVASGSITNREDDTRSYTLSVDFLRSGTDNVWSRVRVELSDVAPGASAVFEVRRAVELDDVDCVVSEVDGPPPFGIDIGG